MKRFVDGFAVGKHLCNVGLEKFVLKTEPELVVNGTHACEFWRRLFTPDTALRFLRETTCPACFAPPSGPVGSPAAFRP